MNELTKVAAVMAVLLAVSGCVVIMSEDSDADPATIYVGGTDSDDETGDGSQAAPYATFSKAYNVAKSGDTIVLNGDDVTISSNMTLVKDLTINLNNHTFDLGSRYILINTGSTLHVTGGGIIKSTGSQVIYAYGNLTMDSGTIDGSSFDINAKGTSTVTLSGTAHVESVNTTMAVFHVSVNTISSISGSYFGVGSTFDCTFGGEVNESAAPPNMKATGTAGSWTFIPLTMEEDSDVIEAYIGDQCFRTLSSALNCLEEGQTVTLNKDCTTSSVLKVSLFRWTLDMNGHSITSTDEYAIEISTDYSADMPDTGSLVTIRGRGDSSITATTPLNIKVGDIFEHVLNFSIEGVDLIPSEGHGKIQLGQGVGLEATEENRGLISEPYFESVTSDGLFIYQSVLTALDNSIDHETTLYGDYSGQFNISAVGNWTINLNGNTVTSGTTDESAVDVLGNGCHLTLKNGTLNSATDGVTIGIPLDGSTITYDDISITLDNVEVVTTAEGAYGVVSNGTSTNIGISIINGSSVKSENGMAVYFPSTGTLTIQDSTISGESGVEVRKGNLSISGNTSITATGSYSVSPNGSGTTMTGAAIAISPYESAQASTMHVSITGGTFEGAVAFSQTNPNDAQNVSFDFSLEDGTFTSTGSNGTGTYAAVVAQSAAGKFITGGKYVGGAGTEDFVDPVHSMDPDSGEVYFDDSKAVLRNGDDYYATFDDAIRAAQDGDVIELVSQGNVFVMTEHIVPRNGNHVTIDLNGRTLDFGTEYRILATSQSGGLTIRDGSLEFGHESPIQVYGCELRFENCVIETTGVFPDSDYEWGPMIFSMFGYDDANTTKRSVLYVDPDCEVIYNDTAEVGAYVVNIFDNSVKAAYGVSVDFRGTMTGNVGLAFYINGNVNRTDGPVPEIHVAMPDDVKVSGGIYAAGYADWDIDSGWFESSTPLSIKSGTFDISGGTFHATGEYNDPADANGNGTEETGAALSITTNKAYAGNVRMLISGGTFISDNGYAVYEGIAVGSDGTPAAPASTAALEITNGTFRGNAERGDVAITEAEDRNVIRGGTFSSDVSEYAADGYAVIPFPDGTYGAVQSDVSDDTITGSGSYSYETEGYVITIPSNGQYDDVTLVLGFGPVDVTISGTVTGNVTVVCYPIDPEDADYAIELTVSGVSDAGMSVTIAIPVAVESGYRIDADSVYAYSVVDGERVSETAYASGDSIVIETTHNTPFYIGYELESELPPFIPFPPQQGGDPVEVWPPEDGGSATTGGDNGGSDTLKVVACAAAAVIAAILIVVWASTYRKN